MFAGVDVPGGGANGVLCPQQVIVHRGDLQAVVDQLAHHGRDLLLSQHEIAHHHRLVAHRLERDPATEGESGAQRHAVK